MNSRHIDVIRGSSLNAVKVSLAIPVSAPQLPDSQQRQKNRDGHNDPHLLSGYENGEADDDDEAQPHKRDNLTGIHWLGPR